MVKSIKFADVKITVHESWNDFLDNTTISCLREIQGQIGENFTPTAEKVFIFLKFDLSRYFGTRPISTSRCCNGTCV